MVESLLLPHPLSVDSLVTLPPSSGQWRGEARMAVDAVVWQGAVRGEARDEVSTSSGPRLRRTSDN